MSSFYSVMVSCARIVQKKKIVKYFVICKNRQISGKQTGMFPNKRRMRRNIIISNTYTKEHDKEEIQLGIIPRTRNKASSVRFERILLKT